MKIGLHVRFCSLFSYYPNQQHHQLFTLEIPITQHMVERSISTRPVTQLMFSIMVNQIGYHFHCHIGFKLAGDTMRAFNSLRNTWNTTHLLPIARFTIKVIRIGAQRSNTKSLMQEMMFGVHISITQVLGVEKLCMLPKLLR